MSVGSVGVLTIPTFRRVTDMASDIKVETHITADMRIVQETSFGSLMLQRVMDIQDEQVRKALIELGWTPPEKKKD